MRTDLSAPISQGLKHVLLPLVAMLAVHYLMPVRYERRQEDRRTGDRRGAPRTQPDRRLGDRRGPRPAPEDEATPLDDGFLPPVPSQPD